MRFTAWWDGRGKKTPSSMRLPANGRHGGDPGRGTEGGPFEFGFQTVWIDRSGLDWPKLTGFEPGCLLDQLRRVSLSMGSYCDAKATP
jgi:hypothetical protein